MKKTLTLLLAILFSMTLFAKSVDIESAKKVGINFFYERSRQLYKTDYKDLAASAVFTFSNNALPVYYVFDFDGKGWVVISAEDAVTPVLAYSFEGRYTDGNKPPQFVAWMDGYAKQIEYSLTHQQKPSESVIKEWERLSATDPVRLNRSFRDVAPLLLSSWDQGNPYNKFCPEDGSGPGGHVWAGCVATAMCQVMYYYRWPNVGNGEHCYTPQGYDQQCANFGVTAYNWEEMMYAHNNSDYNDSAVATLLWHAGIAVDMMYAPNGSGAYSEDAAAAMINYFRYTPNTQLLYKDNYSEAEWAGILRENIDNKRPLYYHGFGTGGHAFNVDGYQGDDFFHFNWGWSGSYNGYYYLSNLNPGGNNFTQGQGAIVNLYPDTVNNSYPENCTGQMVLNCIAGTIEDGSGPAGTYQSNSNCSWLITPQTVSDSITSITINFYKFSTEELNDVVRIYQGGTASDQLVGEYSGDNIPPTVTVNGNKALVTFNSSGSIEKEGWYLSYFATSPDWCKGTTALTEPEGTINDGSFDFNYKNKSNCRWMIAPANSGTLTLTFTAFNSEQGGDILKIYDIGSEQLIGEISGEFSNGNMPGPFTANSGKMFLLWNTNESVTSTGWEGFYSTYPVGTQEAAELPVIQVFPNPASDYINISGKNLQSTSLRMELSNTEGKVVINSVIPVENGTVQKRVSLGELPKGLYILKLISDTDVTLKKILTR